MHCSSSSADRTADDSRGGTASDGAGTQITEPQSAGMRAFVLVTGIVITQVILYGPSLSGKKILLPLDLLKLPRYYLPVTSETRGYVAENNSLADVILSIDLRRRYAAEQVRSGRLPLWNPMNYCGAPFIGANNTAVFSPFLVVDYLFPSSKTIAWVQLLKSLVGGIGTYLFMRRALRLSFWPAALTAWAFPLIGFLILWRGYPPSFVAVWLPWFLLATDATVRRPLGWGPIGLAITTAFLLLSGHAGVAAHSLLASGMYATVALVDAKGRQVLRLSSLGVAAALVGGWGLGFLLSAPQNLTTVEYLKLSRRVARREGGRVEFPSVGPAALPLLIMPYYYGSWLRGSLYIAPGGDYQQGIYVAPNARSEEAAMGYAGLLMALFAAPWAVASRRHRVQVFGWLFIGIFALGHTLGIPGFGWLFHVFPLRLLQNNRFVFVTAFAVLVLAAVGLEMLIRRWNAEKDEQSTDRSMSQHLWAAVPIVLLVLVGGWCLMRMVIVPEPIVRLGSSPAVPATTYATIKGWFTAQYLVSAVLCAIGLAAWYVILRSNWRPTWLPATAAALLVGELVYNAYGVSPQVDPALDYPPLPALQKLAEAPPGRICGYNCLPACLNQTHGLYDIRGYDGAGPRYLMELFERCELRVDGKIVDNHNLRGSQWFIPPPASPILDMLNLRYRIHRGRPPADVEPLFVDVDYWVLESETFLPRVYVPRRYEPELDPERTLDRLDRPDFDARQLALVAAPLAASVNEVDGEATILKETPDSVTIDVTMRTPGLVVLADLWFPGWEAYYKGESVEILRTNHALRGVELPAGTGRLVFRYRPATFRHGLWLAVLALAVIAGWLAIVAIRSSRLNPAHAAGTGG